MKLYGEERHIDYDNVLSLWFMEERVYIYETKNVLTAKFIVEENNTVAAIQTDIRLQYHTLEGNVQGWEPQKL